MRLIKAQLGVGESWSATSCPCTSAGGSSYQQAVCTSGEVTTL